MGTALQPLFGSIAALLLMGGGFSLILQQKVLAGRLFASGVGTAALPALIPTTGSLPLVGIAVVALIAALIFRQKGVAMIIGILLALSFIFPAFIVALIAIPLFFFLGFGALAGLLNPVIGKEATGHVVGTWMVRSIDGIFRRKPRPSDDIL
jgi:hypothetical protein